MNDTYILNVTFHCERSALKDVRYFLEHRLLPNWRTEWANVLLLELPDEQGFAVQIQDPSADKLTAFVPGDDPDVARIIAVYPKLVTFFPTLLKVLC